MKQETTLAAKHLTVKRTSVGGFIMLALAVSALTLLAPTQASSLTTEPTPGCLQVINKDSVPIIIPLEKTIVNADITGLGARVTVLQKFKNTSKTPIEAIYTFPLPHDAAVDRMSMKIGSRVIQGVIQTRENAERIYQEAKNQGKTASLLNQERPNIFTQNVANIMPGQSIDIEISYVQNLKYEAGVIEFSYPMVVGPRYVGDTPDPAKVTPPYVPKAMRTGTGIELNVNVNSATPVSGFKSELHEINVRGESDRSAQIQLARKDEIPNKDFILRYQSANDSVASGLQTYVDQRNGGFFTLTLMPPRLARPDLIAPKEVIFVMDQSGSQRGFPIEKSRDLTRKLIETLGPDDTFNVMGFNTDANWMWPEPKLASTETKLAAMQFIGGLEANGGTNLDAAVRSAYGHRLDPNRRRLIVFNTDGYVGNEASVLTSVQSMRGSTRMFTFGIGNGVNRFLIDAMSAEGRGDSEVITLPADADAATQRFIQRTRNPILLDVKVEFEGVNVIDALPQHIPDVFSEKPIIVRGRFTRPGKGFVIVSGKLGGDEDWSERIPVTFGQVSGHFDLTSQQETVDPDLGILGPTPGRGSSIATLWARAMVNEITIRNYINGLTQGKVSEERTQITNLGLAFGIMTQFTSFVAVESKVVNRGGKSVTVRVPVDMTEGVSLGQEHVAFEAKRMLSSGGRGSTMASGGFGGGGNMPTSAPATKSLGLADSEAGAPAFDLETATDEQLSRLLGRTAVQHDEQARSKLPAAFAIRYFLHTRIDKDVLKSTSKVVTVNIYLKDAPKDILETLKKLGLSQLNHVDPKLILADVKKETLEKLSQIKGVHLVTKFR